MADVTDPGDAYAAINAAMGEVLIGNEPVVERLVISLLTDGHVLLEGPPGVAKTTIAELFATATGLAQNRIQLTPDTLPADITGATVYREATGEFQVQKGPVFANVVVADEINRATPKTQSALLEAMQEQQVTIDGEAYPLPEPFMVIATQNPIEMEGTFELPEAQRDRFQFKLTVEIPDRAAERDLLDRFDEQPDLNPATIEQVINTDTIGTLKRTVGNVFVAPALAEYLLDIVDATRDHPSVRQGASPRAAIVLQDAIKARAAINGRTYAIPDDIKALAKPALAHRLVLDTDATLNDVAPRSIIEEVLASVEAPSTGTIEEAVATADNTQPGLADSTSGSDAM